MFDRKAHYAMNKEVILAQQVKYLRSRHPKYSGWVNRHVNKLWERHKIRPPEWEYMWTVQGGRCLCCHEPMVRGGHGNKVACVDHCHDLNYIRGLLCNLCNRRVGHLEKMPAHVRQYLGRVLTDLGGVR